MLYIVILSFILSLMFFKLKRLENCGFAQLDWLLVTISVNAISTVIKFDLSGFMKPVLENKQECKCMNLRYLKLGIQFNSLLKCFLKTGRSLSLYKGEHRK